MTHPIGISLGDVTGIGPEVTLKALAEETRTGAASFVIIGDPDHVTRLNKNLGLNLSLETWQPGKNHARIAVHNPLAHSLPTDLKPGASAAALAAVAWLKEGAQRCLSGKLAALVTAPVNKASIIAAGQQFVGQTELLSELGGSNRTAMMLLGHDDRGRWLRVALATTHLPIRAVAESITPEKVELAIELADQACHDLELPRSRVGVCGLNPHAGEGGKIGSEEITCIEPSVKRMKQRGLDVVGPMSADALFYYAYRGEYDAVVAMYHDQGLGPLKMIGFESGVNWTLGLPFIRTSPDHGTAYDIAGQGKASPSSMLAAIHLAQQLARKKT